MNPPTIYKRTIDNKFRCVVRTVAGNPVHRGTQCMFHESATEYARLLQRDIHRRAELGDLMPPLRTKDKSR